MSNDIVRTTYYGISLMDYFAAKAMQGLLSNPEIIDNGKPEGLAWIAEHAYKMADAMMAARGEK